MKIVENWDHSCEKRAESCVCEDLDNEVDVECIEDEGIVVHGREGSTAQPRENGKKVLI